MENEKLTRSITFLRSFWNVQTHVMQFIQKRAAENGITVPQYVILMMLVSKKEMTQKSLVETTHMPKSTVSQSVEGLVQAGYVTRQQVKGNRRETQLFLTEEGAAFIKKIHLYAGGVHEVLQTALDTLTLEQYQAVLDAHQKITNHLEIVLMDKGEAHD